MRHDFVTAMIKTGPTIQVRRSSELGFTEKRLLGFKKELLLGFREGVLVGNGAAPEWWGVMEQSERFDAMIVAG